MLSLNQFHPISFDNKYILDSYLEQYPRYHSEYSPVTILSWEQSYPCYFTEYKDELIIDCRYENQHNLYAPIGPLNTDIFEELFQFSQSIDAKISVFDEDSLALIRNLHPEAEIEENRGYFEYCWYSQTLAELTGKSFVGIRKQIHKFLKNFTYAVEPITPENREDVRKMIHTWGTEKKGQHTMLPDELHAIDISLDHYDELHLEGILIRINNEIGAVSIWENSPQPIVLIHYEKGLTKYPGIYKIVNWETAKILKNRYDIINRESDVDEPGLREAKMRYHPELFLKSYIINTQLINL